MDFPVILTLTRYAPRYMRQAGDVLQWEEDRLLVKKRGEVLQEFLYREVHRLRYFHFPTTMSRAFQFMGGNLFQRREAHFELECQDVRHEFWLESDIEFRSNELKELFAELYRSGMTFEEYSHSGNLLFLLDGVSREERQEKLGEIREE